MASLQITDSDIPQLDGKTAIVTGGCSGIGLATVQLLASRGARVYALDLHAPAEALPSGASFVQCDQTSWEGLNAAFAGAGHVDIAIACAGVSEAEDFAVDTWEDEEGMKTNGHSNGTNGHANGTNGTANGASSSSSWRLKEPSWKVIDVNLRSTIGVVKLASAWMRRQQGGGGGSIVVVSSATAYAPEQSLPVYAGTKHGLVGFVRAQRSTLLANDGISINSVAPAATITALLPQNLAKPLMAAGLPVSSAEHVARAVVYSATARQDVSVEEYGKDQPGSGKGKWNGRTILTLGDTYTELESGIAKTKGEWFGAENLRLTRLQQTATDFRQM